MYNGEGERTSVSVLSVVLNLLLLSRQIIALGDVGMIGGHRGFSGDGHYVFLGTASAAI